MKRIGQLAHATKSQDDPESKFLRVGEVHRLNRQQVEKFVAHLQSWLDTGSLKIKTGE